MVVEVDGEKKKRKSHDQWKQEEEIKEVIVLR